MNIKNKHIKYMFTHMKVNDDYSGKKFNKKGNLEGKDFDDAKGKINRNMNEYFKGPAQAPGPLRIQNFRLKGDKKEDFSTSELDNKYVDFDLYDSRKMINSTTNTSSYDPYTKSSYTSYDDINTPLVNPIKNSYEYYMSQMTNCLNHSIYNMIRHTYNNNILFFSPYAALCTLSILYYLTTTATTTTQKDSRFTTFFQKKSVDMVITSILKLNKQLDSDKVIMINYIFTNVKMMDQLNSMYGEICNVIDINKLMAHREILEEINKIFGHNCINGQLLSKYYGNSNQIQSLLLYNVLNITLTPKHDYARFKIHKLNFHGKNGDRVIRGITYTDAFLYYGPDTDSSYKILEIPCNGNLSFGIILDKSDTIVNVKYQELEPHIKNLKMIHFTKITIPYIKQQIMISLKGALANVGLSHIFNAFNTSFGPLSVGIFNQCIRLIMEQEQGASTGTFNQNQYIASSMDLSVNRSFTFYVRNTSVNTIILYGSYS